MAALTAQRRQLTSLMLHLNRSAKISPSHPTMSKTSCQLIRTRQALRVEGRKAKHNHDTAYYHHIQTSIHKSLQDPRRSNAIPWSIAHKHRNQCRPRAPFPALMKPKRQPRAKDPRSSAILFRDTWAHISTLDDNDPIFDVEHAKAQRHHFNTWHSALKANPDIPRAVPDAPFTVADTKNAGWVSARLMTGGRTESEQM